VRSSLTEDKIDLEEGRARLYLGFAFSRKPPHAHTFYVTLPVAMLFSVYCWNEFLQICGWVTYRVKKLRAETDCGKVFKMTVNFSREASIEKSP
jgi:hypothetical protein